MVTRNSGIVLGFWSRVADGRERFWMSPAGLSSIRRHRLVRRVRSWAASGAVGFARFPSTASGSNVMTDFFLYTTPGAICRGLFADCGRPFQKWIGIGRAPLLFVKFGEIIERSAEIGIAGAGWYFSRIASELFRSGSASLNLFCAM